ncbi:MAG: Gfo/Idh/MocA family oxidoreductase [Lentisphaerae bacterium]|nr:Gfo/Idh/MocA family oxidoreductase [Lentisphaerota bacterium]
MTVKIGLIGAGGISGVHVSSLLTLKDARLVAFADINIDNARTRAKQVQDAVAYSDFQEMLDKETLDAVYLCTPPGVRYEPIAASVAKGLPVFCEKPAASNVADAEKTLDVIKRSGVHVEVGYVLRHLRIIKKLRELLEDDRVVTVTSLYSSPMALDYYLGKTGASWFFDQSKSGGALSDQATHTFDLIRHYAGEINSVAVRGTNKFNPKTEVFSVEDSHTVSMTTDDGVVISHTHTWCHPQWRHFHIICGEKRFYELNLSRNILSVTEGAVKTEYAYPTNGYAVENKHFVDMVRAKDFSASVSDYEDAVKTFKLTAQCLVANVSGKFENL